MTRFRYNGIAGGKKVSGFIEADDAQAARAALRERGVLPVSVEPAPLRGAAPGTMRMDKVLFTRKVAVDSSLETRLARAAERS